MREVRITSIGKKVSAEIEIELDDCTVEEAIERIREAEEKMKKEGYSNIIIEHFERYETPYLCLSGSRDKTEGEKLTSLQMKNTIGYHEYLKLKRKYEHLDED